MMMRLSLNTRVGSAPSLAVPPSLRNQDDSSPAFSKLNLALPCHKSFTLYHSGLDFPCELTRLGVFKTTQSKCLPFP